MMARRRLLISLLQLTDLCVILAALLATLAVTGDTLDLRSLHGLLHTPVTMQNLVLLAGFSVTWHIVLGACGLYDSYRLAPSGRELRDLLLAVSVVVLPLYVLGLLRPGGRVDLVFAATLGTLTFLGLATERRLLRAAGGIVRRLGRNLRVIVIVGESEAAAATAAKLAEHAELGYRVAATIGVEATGGQLEARNVVARLDAVLDEQAVDEVLLALPLDRSQPLFARLIATCEEQGITVRLLASVAPRRRTWTAVDTLGGYPVVTIACGPSSALLLSAKRLIDLAGALAGILVFSPLMLLVALAVRMDSPGPVIFKQQRVGLHRRRFWAYKFRTMVTDAEKLQAQLESRNEAQGPVFKIRNDPRITRVGSWLRRTSLDELPQLFNVLKGEMSLVGPRPLPVRDVDRIDVRWHKRRFSVKPGMTCLWQVRSREPKFDEWIRADMEYIDNWSLALDFKILALTVPAVLSRQGAH